MLIFVFVEQDRRIVVDISMWQILLVIWCKAIIYCVNVDVLLFFFCFVWLPGLSRWLVGGADTGSFDTLLINHRHLPRLIIFLNFHKTLLMILLYLIFILAYWHILIIIHLYLWITNFTFVKFMIFEVDFATLKCLWVHRYILLHHQRHGRRIFHLSIKSILWHLFLI